jgi:hypothetical protein
MVQITQYTDHSEDEDMKRLFLVASLCIAAAVAVPVASAGAATLEGACTVSGQAKFEPGKLNQVKEEKLKYTFTSTSAACRETSGAERKVKSAKVTGGEFKGTCLGPATNEIDGTGTLELEGPPETLSFALDFESALGLVRLKLEKGAEEPSPPQAPAAANGFAEFFTSTSEPAALCPLGVSELEFKAVVAGKVG